MIGQVLSIEVQFDHGLRSWYISAENGRDLLTECIQDSRLIIDQQFLLEHKHIGRHERSSLHLRHPVTLIDGHNLRILLIEDCLDGVRPNVYLRPRGKWAAYLNPGVAGQLVAFQIVAFGCLGGEMGFHVGEVVEGGLGDVCGGLIDGVVDGDCGMDGIAIGVSDADGLVTQPNISILKLRRSNRQILPEIINV